MPVTDLLLRLELQVACSTDEELLNHRLRGTGRKAQRPGGGFRVTSGAGPDLGSASTSSNRRDMMLIWDEGGISQ